jgi:predicted outer membrane protein
MKLTPFIAAGLAVAFTASVAFAQAPAPAPATTPMAPAASTKSAKSIECSKEADAKGLHGTARKKFRAACKKGEDTSKM